MSGRTLAAAFLIAGCLPALDPTQSLSQYAKRNWQVEDGLPGNYVTSLSLSPEGFLLVGTNNGAADFDGLEFRPFGLPGEWVNDLYGNPDGSVWLAYRDTPLTLWRDGAPRRRYPRTLTSIRLASRRLTGFGGGLWDLTDGEPRNLIPGIGPPTPSWQNLLPEADQSLLIAASNGVSRFRDGRLSPAPCRARQPLTLSRGRGTGLWIGASDGLYRGADCVPVEGVPGPVVWIHEDRDGLVWIATWGHGLYRIAKGRVESFAAKDGLPDDFVHTLLEDSEGNLWIGTRTGLSRWKSAAAIPVGVPEGMSGQFVSAISGAPGGGVLIGTWRSGLYRWRDGALVKIPLPQRDDVFLVGSLGLSPRGEVQVVHWDGPGFVGSGREWRRTEVTAIPPDPDPAARKKLLQRKAKLPPPPYHAVIEDYEGALWFSTPAGVYQLAQGSDEPVAYTQFDGMRSVECQKVGQPAGWRDDMGDIWFATVKGAVRLRPALLRPRPAPPVVVLSSLRQGEGHVVRYSAVRLSSPEKVEFRYRMGGDWTPVGHERALRFANLPAGEHLLEIAAREEGGPWGPAQMVALFQPPRLYETSWFRLAALAAFGGLLFAVYRWRIFLVRGRYRAVLAERNRISREWHDTLLAGFSAISWQLDATLDRLRSSPEGADKTVEVARTMVHYYRDEARRVIWDLRSDEPVAENLPVAIRKALEELTAGSPVTTSVTVAGSPVPLDIDLRQNMLRICQEAAANAVRHAGPSRIAVRLGFQDGTLEVRIEDDGKGFDPAVPRPGHFGLEIMLERARRFGGTLEVRSKEGQGTVVVATVPVAERP